jgi:site-specific recombinase XerD
MEVERGLAPLTIQRRAGHIGQFLRWYGPQERAFSEMRLVDVDAFLAHGATTGWSRVSVNNVASALRAFLRYAAMQGWCSANLADAIRGPRIFAEEALPAGPDWSDVQRVLARMQTDRPADIRDRAMLLLFALYGLRTSEVAALTLEDIDWENDQLQVAGAKGGKIRAYPLLSTVGNAIARYLKTVRPHSSSREVFLTLRPPFRPLSRGTLYGITQQQLRAVGVRTKHYGPHALRHACAARLVSEGLSLKEIGDHLGHQSPKTTRIYAKVDLPSLREVAAFDLGELS